MIDFSKFYAAFEERYRGSYSDVKKRFEPYIPLVSDCEAGTQQRPILDLGSGRGEWLELLNENSLLCEGIDSNPFSVELGRSRHLNIRVGDIFDILEKSETNKYGAITAFHLIEHLEYKQQLQLFNEVFRVLLPGGLFLIEWPNIENIAVSSYNFWLDPTHIRPVPALLLSFMAEYSGFVDIELQRYRPGPGVQQHAANSVKQKVVDLLRQPSSFEISNFEALNRLLGVGQDISLNAKKPDR